MWVIVGETNLSKAVRRNTIALLLLRKRSSIALISLLLKTDLAATAARLAVSVIALRTDFRGGFEELPTPVGDIFNLLRSSTSRLPSSWHARANLLICRA